MVLVRVDRVDILHDDSEGAVVAAVFGNAGLHSLPVP